MSPAPETLEIDRILRAMAAEMVGLDDAARALTAGLATRRLDRIARAVVELDRAIGRTEHHVHHLTAGVAALDRALLGDRVESVGELALRLTTVAIAHLLDRLTGALCDPSPRRRAAALFVGRLRSIDDVSRAVRDHLASGNATWLRHRTEHLDPQEPPLDLAREMERRILYRHAIRTAPAQLASLGDDPDLAHFLRAGASRVDWPEVADACRSIVSLAGIPIDLEATHIDSPPVDASGTIVVATDLAASVEASATALRVKP